jgi:phage-related minor tail protein
MAPKEMETAVTKAVKEATERLTLEGKNREELMKKEFEGERNVLKIRIESLEKTVKDQQDQIAKLSQQVDKSYQKVEEMAVKALETSSTAQSFAGLQQMLTEQGRRQPQDK